MPFRLFSGADYFLHLYSVMRVDADFPWVPWSLLYMREGCPEWLLVAKSRRKFGELAQAFGMNTEGFRKRYGEVLPLTIRSFPPGGLLDFDLPAPGFLGSVP